MHCYEAHYNAYSRTIFPIWLNKKVIVSASHWPCNTPLSTKVGIKIHQLVAVDQLVLFDSGLKSHRVCFVGHTFLPQPISMQQHMNHVSYVLYAVKAKTIYIHTRTHTRARAHTHKHKAHQPSQSSHSHTFMSPMGLRTKNSCAGEGWRQFNKETRQSGESWVAMYDSAKKHCLVRTQTEKT
jgi:hypothetical protein